jgi:hypothetical protein
MDEHDLYTQPIEVLAEDYNISVHEMHDILANLEKFTQKVSRKKQKPITKGHNSK